MKEDFAMPPEPGELLPASAEGHGEKALAPTLAWRVRSLLRSTLVVVEMDFRKLRHDPIELLTRAIQPALWLLIFGQVFARTRAIPSGDLPYLDFMAPGILAQSVLFIAIFFGISVIWERDLGLVHKLLATPAPRAALVAGKGIAAGGRALSQAVFVYALAAVLGVKINFNPLAIAGVALTVVLGAALFATFSLIIACIVKTRERFMGIGQVLTMPLFFASNAIYPIQIMPDWLKAIARFNPLTYQVDALRSLMVQGGSSAFNLAADWGIMLAILIVLTAIGARLYRGLVL
jgi:ABC-2 type transport system permease protein